MRASSRILHAARWCVAVLPALACAQTFVEPSEVDLRAAYCVEVVTQEVGALFSVPMRDQNTRVLMAEEIARGQATIERLRAYLDSRDPDLSKAALVAAVAQAQADKEGQRRIFEDCTNRCGTTVRGCVQVCVDADENYRRLVARFRACREPAWLPH